MKLTSIIKHNFLIILVFATNILFGQNKIIADSIKAADTTNIISEIVKMEEVIITATRIATPVKDVAVLTQIVTLKQISESGVDDVTNVIANSTPAPDFYNQGSGQTFSLMGIGSKYTLFLIDGERIAGENHDNIDYNRLLTSNIDKIEIIKGASSSLYGSNAIGGVINIISHTPTKPFESNIYGRFTKFNEMLQGISFGFHKKKFISFTDISRKSSNGYDLTPETPDLYTIEPFLIYNTYQKFIYKPTTKLTLTLNGTFYSRERFDVSSVPVHPLYNDYSAGLKVKNAVCENLLLNFDYHFDKYSSVNILEQLENQKKDIYSDLQHTGRVSTEYTKLNGAKIEKHQIISGFELFIEEMFSERIIDTTKNTTNFNFFIQDELKFNNKFTVLSGARYDYNNEFGGTVSPRISLMFSHKKLKYRATYGHGFRAPGIKERYYDFDIGFIIIKGNDTLRPEHSQFVSFSVEHFHKKFHSALNIYFNRIFDMIHDIAVTGSNNSYTYINFNKVNLYGLEFYENIIINKNIRLNCGYSYTYAIDLTQNTELAGVNKHIGQTGLEFHGQTPSYKYSLSLNGKIYSSKTFINLNPYTYSFFEDEYPAYSIWRATFSQSFMNNSLKLSLGINNIFNYLNKSDLINIDPGRRLFCSLNISPDTFYKFFKNNNN